jgi:hypothetical protein
MHGGQSKLKIKKINNIILKIEFGQIALSTYFLLVFKRVS